MGNSAAKEATSCSHYPCAVRNEGMRPNCTEMGMSWLQKWWKVAVQATPRWVIDGNGPCAVWIGSFCMYHLLKIVLPSSHHLENQMSGEYWCPLMPTKNIQGMASVCTVMQEWLLPFQLLTSFINFCWFVVNTRLYTPRKLCAHNVGIVSQCAENESSNLWFNLTSWHVCYCKWLK